MKNFLKKIICVISPTLLSKYLFYRVKKKKLDLKNPVWFNEKLMWLKLYNYNHNSLVWKCVDKYEVRSYLREKGINDENMTNILYRYSNVNEIDFDKLPNKFAIKCTHGCGFNIICEDKNNLNYKKTKSLLNKWINTKFGYETAQLQYNHVKPTIICEEFIENTAGEYPIDYKIYCFNGKPKLTLVCSNRKKSYKTSFYDINWNRIRLRKIEADNSFDKPQTYEEMISICEKISRDFPFVRVDFYEYKGKPIIGELTFTPAACLGEYSIEGEKQLGSWLEIK